MRRTAMWGLISLLAGAGCSFDGRESVAGKAEPQAPTAPARTVLRIPFVDEGGQPFARFNDRIQALGQEPLPAFVEVADGDHDLYWKLSQRIEELSEQIPEMNGWWGGGMPNDYRGICFHGDPREVVEAVGALTDSFFSDQLGIIGTKYGKDRWIDEDDVEWEDQYGETWSGWNEARPEVLIMAVSNDDGDDITPNVVPPCGEPVDCDVLDDRAMDLCIPDDDEDVDVWACVTDDGFAEGHATIEIERYAATCCALGDRLWCEDMPGTPTPTGPAVTVVRLELPEGVSSEEGFLGRMKVTVTGGDRFSQLALARTLSEGRETFGEECDGVPTGDDVGFSENASVADFLGFLRTHTEEWTYKMTPAEIDALEAWLQGVGAEQFRVFYGRSSGEVCGGSGEVSYNLVWNVQTDEVLYLILYPYSE